MRVSDERGGASVVASSAESTVTSEGCADSISVGRHEYESPEREGQLARYTNCVNDAPLGMKMCGQHLTALLKNSSVHTAAETTLTYVTIHQSQLKRTTRIKDSH